jgi:hypothetical protein
MSDNNNAADDDDDSSPLTWEDTYDVMKELMELYQGGDQDDVANAEEVIDLIGKMSDVCDGSLTKMQSE